MSPDGLPPRLDSPWSKPGPEKPPTLSQDEHGAWWVRFDRLGPGAVIGPLVSREAALRYLGVEDQVRMGIIHQPSTEELDKMIEEIAGSPDYAVVWSVWPWPDGGYMAGVVLTDREYATRQVLMAAKLKSEFTEADWNEFDGYIGGLNVHATTWWMAIVELHTKLKELP